MKGCLIILKLNKIKNNQQEIGKALFLLSFVIFIISSNLRLTMFPVQYQMFVNVCVGLEYISIFMCIIKIIFFNDSSTKQLLILLFIGILLAISAKEARSHDVLNAYVFICGSRNIGLKSIFKTSFWTMLSILVITIFSSKFGILFNLAYFRDGVFRYSLGESYPTVLSSIVFFICTSFVCWHIKNTSKKFIAITCLSVLAVGFFLYILTNTRNDLFCSIMLSVVVCWRYYEKLLKNSIFKATIVMMPTLISLWTILSAYCYKPTSKVWYILNDIFSDRLMYVSVASHRFPLKIFGQYIAQQGNGSTLKQVTNYFFIDSSFSRVLFMNGLFSFVLLYLALQLSFILIIKQNKTFYAALLIIFVVTMIEGTFSTMFTIIGFNATLFMTKVLINQNKGI
ncbi:hypothetical protein BGL39_05045 [Fructilactobacillus sanfranciscensis]|uniref:hypothetical protein n=1 Tax=Fructilactobacillus sanfranciscensis TaxID=1625 RepID=UPI000CD47616|nr:hypothetical protein [Fructilactobacillus sanfranciscensis]POH08552.1 hypothetical protein BGL37_05125 [Fructilactobacillus sanfranciscensis]POH09573.1 hypothetical protein BGL39_05045 [Fructilactobacillus sanfranciscensis]POH15849.1 hypothetical protein BGL42_05480 [Fructilactobacillus sanfranciscensis]